MPNGSVNRAVPAAGIELVVKFATRLSSAGAGATRTRLVVCTPMAAGPPLFGKLIGDGKPAGYGVAGAGSVYTGSHWTEGTVRTDTDLPAEARNIESTERGPANFGFVAHAMPN